MKQISKVLTSFPMVFSSTVLVVVFITCTPSISVSRWVRLEDELLSKIEIIQQNFQKETSIPMDKSEYHLRLFYRDDIMVGFRIPSGVWREIVESIEKSAGRSGFFKLFSLLIGFIFYIVLIIIDFILSFLNPVSALLGIFWLYLRNFVGSSKWEEIRIKIPIKGGFKNKLSLLQNNTEFRIYEGIMSRIPIEPI
jgi:hypothetical protein